MAAAAIDEYVASLPPGPARVVAAARAVIDATLDDASAAVLWGHPTWSVRGEPVCYLRALEDGVVLLGFWYAGSLDDPSGRIRAHGSIMGHAELRAEADVQPALLERWLREARELAIADAERKGR